MTGSPKKHARIQAHLRERILRGHWKVGDKLPNDAELAQELGCSIGTLGKALGLLAHDGFVARKPKAGTTILRNTPLSRSPAVQLDAFAFIYPSDRHEGISRMLHGFEDAAREKSRRLVTLPTGADFKKELEIIGRLDEFDVRGAVACPAISTPDEQLKISQLLLAARLPVVLVGLALPGFSTAAVLLDNFHAGYEMTRHLLERGHKRIGFLSNHSWIQFMRDRFSGYRRAMEEAGLEVPSTWVHLASAMHANFSDPILEPMEIAKIYLAGNPSVDAVVCSDDFMAVGLMAAATAKGLKLPDDLAITGMDDFSIARLSSPLLTTYQAPYEEMGRRAFELLLSLTASGIGQEDEICLRGQVIARQST